MPSLVQSNLLMAFRIPAYRWIWTSSVLASNGSMSYTLVQGWLILELTDSPLMVGLAPGLSGVASLIFSSLGGILADRLDRRKLVMASMVSQALVVLVVGVLTTADIIRIWHLLVAAVVMGTVRALQGPARSSLTYDMVGRDVMMNAMAGQFMALHGTSMIGPLVAGSLLASIGPGPLFLGVAALGLVAASLLLPLQRPPRSQRPAGSFWQNFREGIAYVANDRLIRTVMLTILLTESLGFPARTMFPVVVRDLLHAGPFVLGLLSTVWGIGGVTAAVLLSSLGNVRNKGWLFMASALGFGVLLVLFAFSRSIPLSLTLLFLAGAFAVTYDTMATTLLQLLADDRMRGRVMGLYQVVLSGVSMGGLLIGGLASAFGVTAAISINGAAVTLNAVRMMPVARQIAARTTSTSDR